MMISTEQEDRSTVDVLDQENQPSMDIAADAPRSVDVSVAARTLRQRRHRSLAKGVGIGLVVGAVAVPLTFVSGWVGGQLGAKLYPLDAYSSPLDLGTALAAE